MKKYISPFLPLLFVASPLWLHAQEPNDTIRTDTRSKYVVLNSPKQFSFLEDSVQFIADFPGARLNDVYQENDSTFRGIIRAENYPINPSPWYAFKAFNGSKKVIYLHLTYQGAEHRYYPKISNNNVDWKKMDTSYVKFVYPFSVLQTKDSASKKPPSSVIIKFSPNQKEAQWIAGQPIIVSSDVWSYVRSISQLEEVKMVSIGMSKKGRELPAFRIGKLKEGKPIILFISRQHPPEVTGYFALQSFLSPILDTSQLAKTYRKSVVTYVLPLMNPDGVDYGHWRHNAGGVDLNRDWANQFQQETKQTAYFIDQIVDAYSTRLIAMIDFHSTHYDVVYTNSQTHQSHLPNFLDSVLCRTARALNSPIVVKPSSTNNSAISKGYFYNLYDAESMVYEVGDTTPRITIHNKAYRLAEQFMKTLLFDYNIGKNRQITPKRH